LIIGSLARIEDSLVGHTEPTDGGGNALVLLRQSDIGVGAQTVVRRSVVERGHGFGVSSVNSQLDVEATVIRNTAPDPNGLDGMGMFVTNELPDLTASFTMRRSVVVGAHTCGLCVGGMDALIESVVVRDVEPQASSGLTGRGLSLESTFGASGTVIGTALMRGSLVERTHEVGVAAIASEATIESTIIRDIASSEDGIMGRGINIEIDRVSGLSAVGHIEHVLVEDCHEFGIFIGGATATVQRSTIRNILPRPFDGLAGVGITVQMSFETGVPSNGTISDTLIEHTQQSGVAVIGSSATFVDVVVRDSMPDGNGFFGDGLLASGAFWDDVLVPTDVHVQSSRIEGNTRAGILAFATDVALQDSHMECNAIHLNGESFEDIGFNIRDLGGNTCGCAGANGPCKVLSSNLDVPDPIR
jgi:hypothetical protein